MQLREDSELCKQLREKYHNNINFLHSEQIITFYKHILNSLDHIKLDIKYIYNVDIFYYFEDNDEWRLNITFEKFNKLGIKKFVQFFETINFKNFFLNFKIFFF
jgi:hypothetical protein